MVQDERMAFFRYIFLYPDWTYDTLPDIFKRTSRRRVQRMWHERPKCAEYATCVDDVIRAYLEADPPVFSKQHRSNAS